MAKSAGKSLRDFFKIKVENPSVMRMEDFGEGGVPISVGVSL